MTALWLLPLLLLGTQLAHAQQAPALPGLVPDVSLPAPPAPATSAVPGSPAVAVDTATAGSAAPTPVAAPTTSAPITPVPTTQQTFPSGHIRPPTRPRGAALGVPAYPGTPPYRFASPTELAEYGTWRVERLGARERGLSLTGRPPHYLAKRIGGFVAGGVGARDEMADLRREQKEWRVEVKRARRNAKRAAHTSFNLTSLQVRF